MHRAVLVAILGFWMIMLALLVQRVWLPSTAQPGSAAQHQPVLGEEWMGVYYKDQKIGYTRESISAELSAPGP
jgi:hypothetical protein